MGAVVGGVLGGIAAILIAVGVFVYLRRRKARQRTRLEKSELAADDQTTKQGIYSNDNKPTPGTQEVAGDFVQTNDYKVAAERHEVPGDFAQRESAYTHAEPEVHEMGPGSQISQVA